MVSINDLHFEARRIIGNLEFQFQDAKCNKHDRESFATSPNANDLKK